MRHSHRPYARLLALLDRPRLGAAAPPGTRLLVGVSGGADSIALLHALVAESKAQNLIIQVCHIDHGLRPESAGEAQFVAAICKELNVPCHIRRITEAAQAVGGSREAYWRKLRYQEYLALASEHSCDAVALGHTADDLAETFLFHLARGTGIDGLIFQFDSVTEVETEPREFPKSSGPTKPLRIIRPLWKTPRTNIESALRELQHTWINDPSNSNLRHSRNLIRHHVIPVLREINPQASAAIVRASEAIQLAVKDCKTPTASDLTPSHDDAQPAAVPDAFPLPYSAPLQMEQPPPVLPLTPMIESGMHEWEIAENVRCFASEHGTTLSSKQSAQASFMISWKRDGIVALSEGKTLVLTRHFAWIFPHPEPSLPLLAAEHARRFGGFYAELTAPVPLKSDPGVSAQNPPELESLSAQITSLEGRRWIVRSTGISDCVLSNRDYGARVGNTTLKRLINRSQVPWYLRDLIVFVARPDSKGVQNIVAAVGEHGELNALIARKNLHNPEIQVHPISPGA